MRRGAFEREEAQSAKLQAQRAKFKGSSRIPRARTGPTVKRRGAFGVRRLPAALFVQPRRKAPSAKGKVQGKFQDSKGQNRPHGQEARSVWSAASSSGAFRSLPRIRKADGAGFTKSGLVQAASIWQDAVLSRTGESTGPSETTYDHETATSTCDRPIAGPGRPSHAQRVSWPAALLRGSGDRSRPRRRLGNRRREDVRRARGGSGGSRRRPTGGHSTRGDPRVHGGDDDDVRRQGSR